MCKKRGILRYHPTRENQPPANLVRPKRETFASKRAFELDFRYHLVLHPIMTKPTQKGAKMKTRKIVATIALSAGVLLILGTCVTPKIEPALPDVAGETWDYVILGSSIGTWWAEY